MRLHWLLSLMVGVLGCSSSEAPKESRSPEPTSVDESGPPVDQSTSAVATADAAVVASRRPPPPTRPAKAPGSWGDYCEADSECGWNDSCFPSACVASESAAVNECDKTTPPPGECRCVAHYCTLKPETAPVSPESGCTDDMECVVDPATAICYQVENPEGYTKQGPLDQEGPYCTCDPGQSRCQFQWAERVPCDTFAQCSWERKPRLRPVPAPKPRKKPVRPCKDGEVDSVCKKNPDGSKSCEVIGWPC